MFWVFCLYFRSLKKDKKKNPKKTERESEEKNTTNKSASERNIVTHNLRDSETEYISLAFVMLLFSNMNPSIKKYCTPGSKERESLFCPDCHSHRQSHLVPRTQLLRGKGGSSDQSARLQEEENTVQTKQFFEVPGGPSPSPCSLGS